MPKLLTQVWKTTFGSFFETEQEAVDAEALRYLEEGLEAARLRALDKAMLAYRADLEEWKVARAVDKWGNFPRRPQNPLDSYPFPDGLVPFLKEELNKNGYRLVRVDEGNS
jgi:hypothetical protein